MSKSRWKPETEETRRAFVRRDPDGGLPAAPLSMLTERPKFIETGEPLPMSADLVEHMAQVYAPVTANGSPDHLYRRTIQRLCASHEVLRSRLSSLERELDGVRKERPAFDPEYEYSQAIGETTKEEIALGAGKSSTRTPAESFHPSEYIRDAMEGRGWTLRDLATHTANGDDLNTEIVAWDMYLTVGPESPDLILGQMADGLARAFGTSAQFWRRLERAWREHPDTSALRERSE